MLSFLRHIFIVCNYAKNKKKVYICLSNDVNIYIYIYTYIYIYIYIYKYVYIDKYVYVYILQLVGWSFYFIIRFRIPRDYI